GRDGVRPRPDLVRKCGLKRRSGSHHRIAIQMGLPAGPGRTGTSQRDVPTSSTMAVSDASMGVDRLAKNTSCIPADDVYERCLSATSDNDSGEFRDLLRMEVKAV